MKWRGPTREFSIRVAHFLDEAVERHLGERVAVVTHSGTIDAALRWSLGLAHEHSWQHEFNIPNGSITEVEFWPRGRVKGGSPRYANLRSIGEVTHLGGLATDL